MKRVKWFRGVGLAVTLALLSTLPVLASYTQYIPLTLSENNTSSYSMVAIITPINNAYLYSYNYVASALNTLVSGTSGNLPWMISAGRVNYAQPIAQGASYTNQYALNNAPSLPSTDIVLGSNGSLTVLNSPSLTLGDNFSSTYSGYVDNTKTGQNITSEDLFRVYINSGNVTSYIIASANMTWQLATSFVAGGWTDSSKASDNDVGTWAQYSIPSLSWSPFLELDITPSQVNRVKFYVAGGLPVDAITIDVYSNGGYQNLYNGAFTPNVWTTITFPGGYEEVTAMRISQYNSDGAVNQWGYIKEAQFGVAPVYSVTYPLSSANHTVTTAIEAR